MSEVLDLAIVASLVGDPARANILCALLDGRALTSGELAYAARVSPQTTSGHLGKLARAQLIEHVQQGRHRYYRLAGPQVSAMLESIMVVANSQPPRLRACRIDDRMREARMCYDHVAGKLGVAIADALQARGHVELTREGGEVTRAGEKFLNDLGISTLSLPRRRHFCKPCMDWSERRPHIAGAIGAALAQRLMTLGWLKRVRDGRTLVITPAGTRGLRETFGVSLGEEPRQMQPLHRQPAA